MSVEQVLEIVERQQRTIEKQERIIQSLKAEIERLRRRLEQYEPALPTVARVATGGETGRGGQARGNDGGHGDEVAIPVGRDPHYVRGLQNVDAVQSKYSAASQIL